MKAKLSRTIFQRMMEAGEIMDESAHAIYLEQVKDLSKVLAQANTADAAMRKLAIKSLWRTAGRASEVSYLHLDGIRWDRLFQAPFIECPQSKSSKWKLIPFVAGIDRYADWFVDFGDYLVLDRGSMLYSTGESVWLIPEVHGAGAGTKIANFVRAMQPPGTPGALKKYEDFAITTLPPDPSAASFRPGACDTLAIHMPAEIGVHTTGHDLTNLSALWEYLGTKMALCIPGAIVLSGWRPLPWGQLGRGPVPPSLDALFVTGIDRTAFERFIDKLFSFHDRSPPMFRSGGQLRPMIHHTTATLLMYYEDRFQSDEMALVLASMRDSYTSVVSLGRDNAHSVLCQWGAEIKRKFNIDNLHLTGMHEKGSNEQLSLSMQGLSQNVASMRTSLGEALGHLRQWGESARPPPTPHAAAPPPPDSAPRPTLQPVVSSTTSGESAPPPSATTPIPPKHAASVSGLLPHDNSGGPVETLRDMECARFFDKCMQRGGNLPPLNSADTSRGQLCLDFFKAMATKEEYAQLLGQVDKAKNEQLLKELEELAKKRLAEAYRSVSVPVPGGLTSRKFLVNSLDRHCRDASLQPDAAAFAAFRAGKRYSPLEAMLGRSAKKACVDHLATSRDPISLCSSVAVSEAGDASEAADAVG